ncbi:MAG: OmpA family protein [Rhodospirillales bacterium]|nr:OmpA family protein [Rhodospirillales bacterium]MBO6787982.1 OmpA family protein [Rhodospirillales bacterium]
MSIRTKSIKTGAAAGCLLAVAACANPEIEAAKTLDIKGGDVSAEAAREYKRLAHFEDKEMWDKASAIAFSEKAIAAANGLVGTGPSGDRIVRDAEIAAAYRYLNHMRALGADRIAPKATGQAIARLDCWAEQADEGDQPLHIGFCRDGFAEYASETAEALKAAGRPVAVATPALKTFKVTFPLGSSMPAVGANDVLDAAADYAKSDRKLRIVLGGHADKSGSAKRNQYLSEARADRVANMLRARGVSPSQISTIGFGETYPSVVTPDGQKSDENRRVEIVIGPGRVL